MIGKKGKVVSKHNKQCFCVWIVLSHQTQELNCSWSANKYMAGLNGHSLHFSNVNLFLWRCWCLLWLSLHQIIPTINFEISTSSKSYTTEGNYFSGQHIIWYLYDLWYQSLKIISRLGFDLIHVFNTILERNRKSEKWVSWWKMIWFYHFLVRNRSALHC